jgi:hypothetical protein
MEILAPAANVPSTRSRVIRLPPVIDHGDDTAGMILVSLRNSRSNRAAGAIQR